MTDVRIEFKDKKTGNKGEAEGADGRVDVSSRSDGRPYFASRDQSLNFSAPFEDSSAAAGDYVFYLKNDDTTGKVIVINKISIGAANAAEFKFWFVTGTGSGTAVTPVSTNQSPTGSPNATALSDAISGLSTSGEFAHESCVAGSTNSVKFDDTVRIGKDQAIAIEYDTGTTGKAWGTAHFFFEDKF